MVTLLWGLPPDQPLLAVRNALLGLGADVALLNQRHVLGTRLTLDGPGGPVLHLPGRGSGRRDVPLSDVQAVYLRPYDTLAVDVVRDAPAPVVAQRQAARLDSALWAWLGETQALIVNPLEPSATNGTKPLQSSLARRLGFAVPDTLLTTSAAAALSFLDRHGEVVYKAIGGTRTIAALLDRRDGERLARMSTCPVQLQRFIRGSNIRVHVLGDRAWACEITGQHVDWRRPERGAEPRMSPVTLPTAVADRCRLVTELLGLYLSGIDLIRDHSGEWYFLEANTSPGFTVFPCCDEIARAVGELLHSARTGLWRELGGQPPPGHRNRA